MAAPDIYILFHGRFPSEKAAALFADKSADAFAAQGCRVTLVVPRRRGRGRGLDAAYKTVYVPTLDFFGVPILTHAAYRISYAAFSLSAIFWLLRHTKADAFIVSNEALPLLCASFFFRRTLYELHDFPERSLWLYRALFNRVGRILSTNMLKKKALVERWGISPEKIFMERNAVDVERFAPQPKTAARDRLGLLRDGRLVLYTGHLYSWKGVDTLAEACAYMPDVSVYVVGGTDYDLAQFKKKYGGVPNLHIVGRVPHEEIPLWQAAADVLVLPNTAREDISAQYTSPMKLFEYMASGRPIVASALPSVTELLSANNAFLFDPDNPRALADAVGTALRDGAERAAHAREDVREHTWEKRAARILERLA